MIYMVSCCYAKFLGMKLLPFILAMHSSLVVLKLIIKGNTHRNKEFTTQCWFVYVNLLIIHRAE